MEVHNFVGISWLIAFAFFVFWVFTTGEWRQYIPTTKKMLLVVRYYMYGIFRGEPHPVPKRKDAKHNPSPLRPRLLAFPLKPGSLSCTSIERF